MLTKNPDVKALLKRIDQAQGDLAEERARHAQTKAQVSELQIEIDGLKGKCAALEAVVAREKARADRLTPTTGSGRVIEATGIAKFGREFAPCLVTIEGDRVREVRFSEEPGALAKAMAGSQRLWGAIMWNSSTFDDRHGPQPAASEPISVPVPTKFARPESKH